MTSYDLGYIASQGGYPRDYDPGEVPDRFDVDSTADDLGIVSLSDIDAAPPVPLRLGRLAPDGPSVLFGPGGVGKGVMASWWISQLAHAGERVLILDYESHPGEWARRIDGLGGDRGSVSYAAPHAPGWRGRRGAIWAHADQVATAASALRATFVVIDSVVVACGGADPMKPEVASKYADALQTIALPSLSLAHVTKADDPRYPFGSVFWHNLARVTWSLANDGEDRRLLVNRKANNYERPGRVSVAVTWRDGVPVDVLEQPYTAVLADLIDEQLAAGPMTVDVLMAALNADGEEVHKRDSVLKALKRGLAAVPKRYTLTGTAWRMA